jgi:uncharacterized protein (DUF433 family)
MNENHLPDYLDHIHIERITIDPSICHGKPCVRGLRYPVETLLELLASGMTNEEILADYEDLTHEDILACLAYVSRDVLDGNRPSDR